MPPTDPENLQRTWQLGDKVLAPWEPEFLYAGEIAQIEGIQILIDFDNGKTGWVIVDQLRPRANLRGQQVFCRKKTGSDYLTAKIIDSRQDDVFVSFVDDQAEEWTKYAALRVSCEANGAAAISVQSAAQMAFAESVRIGDRVWAPGQGGMLFAGTVDRILENQVHIHFDDGDQGLVYREQLQPLEIEVGLCVVGRWKMGSQYYPGTVTEIDGERIHIKYDDGDQEWTKVAALSLPGQGAGPDARPTKMAGGGRSLPGWVIPVAIGIGWAILKALLR